MSFVLLMTALLPISIIGASIHGAVQGGQSGIDARNKLCGLNTQIQDYIKTSQEEIQLYKEEWYQRNTKLQGLRNNISNLHQDLKLAHASYNNSMTFFKVFGISLAVIIIFRLVTKKIILHETALPGK